MFRNTSIFYGNPMLQAFKGCGENKTKNFLQGILILMVRHFT